MFEEFKKSVKARLDFLIENSQGLFVVDLDGHDLWELYLNSFPPGTNEIFRERREYECSACAHFITHYGNVVGIIDNKIVSMWDVTLQEDKYQVVANALNDAVLQSTIKDVFFIDQNGGCSSNVELIEGKTHTWKHFHYDFPSQFVVTNPAAHKSVVRQTKDVIKRSFDEIMHVAIATTLELIDSNSLYKGEEFRASILLFQEAKKAYFALPEEQRDNNVWLSALLHGRRLAIRNTAIGTLLIDLSESVGLEVAVTKYEKVVAPENYKRPMAIYTEAMKKDARETVDKLGLTQSLGRKFAHIEDIDISNVIWASGDSKKVMTDAFDLLDGTTKVDTKSYDGADEMTIEDFLKNVVPNATKMELLLENGHNNNLVSLIAPINPGSKTLFKWSNNFSWSYNGEFTDSIKESVKTRGGITDAVVRASLSWAEGDNQDNSDLDLHCKTPASHIYYSHKKCDRTGGMLDVDITQPSNFSNKDIVENIVFTNKSKMTVGTYEIFVHNFRERGTQKGFTVELEVEGVIHTFNYTNRVKNGESIRVADVVMKGGVITVKPHMKSTTASRDVWGVSTMKFVPITTLMFSPNHWGEYPVGNKHYFFMLEDCINTGTPRGFFNEFLTLELDQHKRVFEALGDKMRVAPDQDQLSGVGFSSTMNNAVTIKVDGRPIKINFNNNKDGGRIPKISSKQVSL